MTNEEIARKIEIVNTKMENFEKSINELCQTINKSFERDSYMELVWAMKSLHETIGIICPRDEHKFYVDEFYTHQINLVNKTMYHTKKENKDLINYLRLSMQDAYEDGRVFAKEYGKLSLKAAEKFPKICPWTLEEILYDQITALRFSLGS